MKKILVYLSSENHASLFDVIVGYNAGIDVVVPYGNVSVEEVREMIHNAVFTRAPDDLKNTAIFIGGHDIGRAEEMLDEAVKTFDELPPMFRVSIAIDPDGACTTSSACVTKIKSKLDSLKGLNATVLAGTGPVGQRVAVLLAREGCRVMLTSRNLGRSEEACKQMKEKYSQNVEAFEAKDDETTAEAVKEADIVVATGPEGIEVLPKKIWSKTDRIRIMADVNAVPPYGIGGLEVIHRDVEIEGKTAIGALSIGNLKMKAHLQLIKDLFNENNSVYDLFAVYDLTNRFM